MCVFTEMELVRVFLLLHFEMALQSFLFAVPAWTSIHRAVSLLVSTQSFLKSVKLQLLTPQLALVQNCNFLTPE